VSKDHSKHTVIKGREELCNVKGNDTSLEALGPARVNQVSKKETSVFSRPLSDATKLVGIEDTVLDSIKLESPSNHLLNELAKGVEQNNGPKSLGSVVGWFSRLRDNDRDRFLEVSRLVLQDDTRVGKKENAGGTNTVS